MSVLDRAFIKAYRKDRPSPREASSGRNQEDSRQEGATWNEAVAPAVFSEGFGFDNTVYRVDPCHGGQPAQSLLPHIEFAPPGGIADQAFVSPYHELLEMALAEPSEVPVANADTESELAETSEQLATQNADESNVPATVDAEPLQEDAVAETALAAEENTPSELPGPAEPELPQTEVVQALKRAASLTLPPALELPSLFQPLEDEIHPDPLDADSGDFSPEWEVDRFAWPQICERLLETQSRYFSHVGQRLMAATEENHHVIMISGSRRGEGRTTLAMCLARCATQAGVEVALVDADIQNPELGASLGMETPCSWLEVFAGTAALNEVAVASIEDHLTLIPLSGSEHAEIAAGDRRLISLLRKISAHFPLVVVDAGPVSSWESHLFDGDEVCPVDTAIVVRDLRNTSEQEAMATAQGLQRSGIQAVGVAENFRVA
jgi:Mrp family chromosome partitioning ATPase